MKAAYVVGALRIRPRWIAVDRDVAPIPLRDRDTLGTPCEPFIFEGSREDAEMIARARVLELYGPNAPGARQFHGLMPADRYGVKWIAREGEDGRWAVLPTC